jgi:ABC-type cobalamin transport system ATPase subunit
MNAKDLTIDDLAYLLVSGQAPGSGRTNGETFTTDEIAQVFENKMDELDVSKRGSYAVSSDRQFKLSFDTGRKE